MARDPRPPGPSGGAVLRRLKQALDRGIVPGLTVLTGEDLFHLDAAQRVLLARLVPEESSDFALTVFGEARTDVADVVAAARSRPMFAPRRVVLVRDGSVLEGDEAPLLAYAQSPPPESFLVVRAPRLDQRRSLHRLLASAGNLLEFRPAGNDAVPELRREIAALASDRGLSLDPDVGTFLLESSAGDLYRVVSELDKIRGFCGDGGRVTLEIAREVTSGSDLLTGWEVADALLERDAPGAIAAARVLVDAGQEPIRMLGGLAWRARTLLQAKAMMDAGAGRGQIVAAARAWAYEGKLLAGLHRYSLEELLAFPARLLEADRALKSRSLDARSVLEALLRDLTRPRAGFGMVGA